MKTIGENLNVIKKECGQAFKDRNPEPIQKLALAEKAAGVTYIDINLGPARKGGPELMQWVVQTVQEVVPDVPLALDTSNIEAIEAGLEVHKGTALVNSVMARPERYTVMWPIVAKYEAEAVALLWGPDGLPRDANERSALCVELCYAANELGIPNEKLFVDPIVTPLNIQQEQLMNNLEFLSMLQDICPGAESTNGLSNISNGTPWREPLNQIFMIMMERNGMTSSIVDYEDKLIMQIAQGHHQNLVEIVHGVMDGLINDPGEVDPGIGRTYVAGALAILGKILYSDSWFQIEGGSSPESMEEFAEAYEKEQGGAAEPEAAPEPEPEPEQETIEVKPAVKAEPKEARPPRRRKKKKDLEYGEPRPAGVAGPDGEFIEKTLLRWRARGSGVTLR
ncbi:MAG: dihydropteroate synthase [Desulfarculaceae bacterium]|nr:dihydropteroate synthase [Desulfarculaceae bacterium]